ncbi:Guanine nucleotide-binding protein-like 3 -like protein [Halotydeus destructor]|nr:Guanine nucleotide-binding protein-like 3 -like protein [Halotydeus destructor]
MPTSRIHKKPTKRVTLKKKYKVEKKVREHKRRLRKAARQNGTLHKKPRDPGVPASLPFKEEILREVIVAKQMEEDRKERQRVLVKSRQANERSKKIDALRGVDTAEAPKDLAAFVKDAENRNKKFKEKEQSDGKNVSVQGVSNLNAFYKEFQKVVESADIVLQVLDARDPIGTRCSEVEEAVLKAGSDKRLVLLLNKVDLIPRENLQKWLTYLRSEFPTVAFKASTQSQRSNLGRSSKDILSANDDLLQSSKCLGAQTLMKLIGNYCRSKGVKTAVKVGVVGFPNVGKSSVINSLKRGKACNVGATPGLTRTVQEVSLDKHIKLIDSPGIVFAKLNQFGDAGSGAEKSRLVTSLIALRNATKIETLEDPVTPVEAILSRIKKEDLMLFYKLPDFNSSSAFLQALSRRFGKLKKGGVANTRASAKIVLQDWNSGKLKYYTVPPETHILPSHLSAAIVPTLSSGFGFDEKLAVEEMEALDKGMSTVARDVASAICIPSLANIVVDNEMEEVDEDGGDDGDEEEEDGMAVDGAESVLSASTRIQLRPRKGRQVETMEVEVATSKSMTGMQLNKERKVHFKKQQKQKKRQSKVSEKLASKLDSGMDLNDDYSFEADFK